MPGHGLMAALAISSLSPFRSIDSGTSFGADDDPRFVGNADTMHSESRAKASVIFLPSPKMQAGRPRSRVA